MLSNQTRWCVQRQFPRPDRVVIRSGKQQVTIDGHARDRVLVSMHLLLKCCIPQRIGLNSPIVASNENCAFVVVFIAPELQAEDLIAIMLAVGWPLNLAVFNHVTELGVDCRCSSIHASTSLL